MTGVPFPEYAVNAVTFFKYDAGRFRTQWAGDGASGLLADVLTMATEMDHLYAAFIYSSSDDAYNLDQMVAIESACNLAGLGSVFGFALDVSIHMHWIDDDVRDQFADTEFEPLAGQIDRAIEAAQTEWLTMLRDNFSRILTSFVKVAS